MKNLFLKMNNSGIAPEDLEQIAQCNSTRLKIKILLLKGYSYITIQDFLHCAPKTISAVKRLIEQDEFIFDVKRGPKTKITPDIKEIVLNENFLHPDMALRNLSSLIKDEHNINISKSSIDKVLTTNHCWCNASRTKAITRAKNCKNEFCIHNIDRPNKLRIIIQYFLN